EVPTETDVVVVCRSGVRSAQVTAFLLGNGWDRVSNLDGGMQHWSAAGRAMISEDGQPARVL
ncbi:MAG TPA: rhodanese-like domain-containing protein, partial [Actinoplanes sp.]|nr:rhodanese-like domain-containing protein [Actinoplanes sp.]